MKKTALFVVLACLLSLSAHLGSLETDSIFISELQNEVFSPVKADSGGNSAAENPEASFMPQICPDAATLAKVAGGQRSVSGLQISVVDNSLILNWEAVPNVQEYRVYSSSFPNYNFTLDESGVFSETTWTAPISSERRFYYVSAVLNALNLHFAYVPGGTFQMGDTHGVGNFPESPVHTVTVNSFLIAKHLVTQSLFLDIMGFNPSDHFGIGPDYPVHDVSWYLAIKFCNMLSITEGRTPVYSIYGHTDPIYWGDVPTENNEGWNNVICNWNADGYRLPTEAEWEYAARGATNDPDYLYSGSHNIDEVAWYWENNDPWGPKPIGLKAPNALGIYDMTGNVREWCWDWFDNFYYENSPTNNPTGPATGTHRSARGGDYQCTAQVSRNAFRHPLQPTDPFCHYFGIRLCRSVSNF